MHVPFLDSMTESCSPPDTMQSHETNTGVAGHGQTVQYIQPQHHERLAQAELLVIDEAAAIPLPRGEAPCWGPTWSSCAPPSTGAPSMLNSFRVCSFWWP